MCPNGGHIFCAVYYWTVGQRPGPLADYGHEALGAGTTLKGTEDVNLKCSESQVDDIVIFVLISSKPSQEKLTGMQINEIGIGLVRRQALTMVFDLVRSQRV